MFDELEIQIYTNWSLIKNKEINHKIWNGKSIIEICFHKKLISSNDSPSSFGYLKMIYELRVDLYFLNNITIQLQVEREWVSKWERKRMNLCW